MKTKPREIGTKAETAIVKILRQYWPTADRSPLRGSRDQGDIRGTGQFIWEAKAGNAAREIAHGDLVKWMTQAEAERVHAEVDYGVLVTTRLGYGEKRADQWWAWLPISQFSRILGNVYFSDGEDFPIRLELGALLRILADHGHCPDAPWTDPTAPIDEAELIPVG